MGEYAFSNKKCWRKEIEIIEAMKFPFDKP
jgi:hypothetical protein